MIFEIFDIFSTFSRKFWLSKTGVLYRTCVDCPKTGKVKIPGKSKGQKFTTNALPYYSTTVCRRLTRSIDSCLLLFEPGAHSLVLRLDLIEANKAVQPFPKSTVLQLEINSLDCYCSIKNVLIDNVSWNPPFVPTTSTASIDFIR